MLRSAIGKLDAWYLDYLADLSQADGEAVLSFNLWMGTGADEPRGDAAASGDPRRLSQGAIGRILVQCGITPPRDTLTTFCIAVNPGGGRCPSGRGRGPPMKRACLRLTPLLLIGLLAARAAAIDHYAGRFRNTLAAGRPAQPFVPNWASPRVVSRPPF